MNTIRIMVPVEKIEKTIWFYTDGLGLEEEPRADGVKVFTVAGQQRIELVTLPGALAETRTNIRFHVHGIQECLRYLVSSGHLSRTAASAPWTREYEMDITDPAGNVITLLDADRPAPKSGKCPN
ncbi:VOC family protein [Bradyrhizobium sp. SHOUNA76]|uniref:VOC family protein n=1 Tax=Bradyrhizobium sp. SHOUNA76 TaxID=2908927 RepID=UPI001FF38E08|nr:VOC family protein [Bradyrhizobium sp. SHOUNA76]MCJ9699627.1 VOC family protein [Bradyrhizobium sp. SHOUNA76]